MAASVVYILGQTEREYMMLERLPNCAIRPDYSPRLAAAPWDDRPLTNEAQQFVYNVVREIMRRCKLGSVFDIGCGSGFKLVHTLAEYCRVGSEVEPCFSFLQETYPDDRWILSELDKPCPVEGVDLVLAADVIEHLVNPDLLMNYIAGIAGWKYLLLSTPDRDWIHGPNHLGPPGNAYHIREWSPDEFYRYVVQWFPIESIQLRSSQMILCKRDKWNEKR